MKQFDVSKKVAPYGAIINTITGEHQFYDVDGVVFDNQSEIAILEEELNIKSNSDEFIKESTKTVKK
jgi:hypothetical protein